MGSSFKRATVHQDGKVWRQEHETAVHITPAVSKQKEMNAGVQLTISSPNAIYI